jgi:hypothetical protein
MGPELRCLILLMFFFLLSILIISFNDRLNLGLAIVIIRCRSTSLTFSVLITWKMILLD